MERLVVIGNRPVFAIHPYTPHTHTYTLPNHCAAKCCTSGYTLFLALAHTCPAPIGPFCRLHTLASMVLPSTVLVVVPSIYLSVLNSALLVEFNVENTQIHMGCLVTFCSPELPASWLIDIHPHSQTDRQNKTFSGDDVASICTIKGCPMHIYCVHLKHVVEVVVF